MKQFYFSLILFLCVIPCSAEFKLIDKIAIVVDDAVISEQDIDLALTRINDNLRQQNQPIPDADTLRQLALDNLITQTIQLQIAKRGGVYITEEQLTQAVNTLAQRKGQNLDDFINSLASDGINYRDFRNQIKNELMMQQVQQSYLRNRINISDQAIAEYLNSHEGQNRIQSKYSISHLFIRLEETATTNDVNKAKKVLTQTAESIRNKTQQFSDFDQAKTVQGFSISNGDLGTRSKAELPSLFAEIVPTMQPGELSEPIRSGAGWHVVKLEDLAGAAKIVFQVKARHILIKTSAVRDEVQAKTLINELYARIQKGEDFSLLAKEYSEDPGSALQGGELGFAEPTKYVGTFQKNLTQLKKNQISKPFKSEFGWHIVQKQDERMYNLTEEVQKNQALQALYQKKAGEEIDSWILQIKDEAFIDFKNPKDKALYEKPRN